MMETEAKAKVIASVWDAAFIKFLAALAVLPRSIWKKGFFLFFQFQIDLGKIASTARN